MFSYERICEEHGRDKCLSVKCKQTLHLLSFQNALIVGHWCRILMSPDVYHPSFASPSLWMKESTRVITAELAVLWSLHCFSC